MGIYEIYLWSGAAVIVVGAAVAFRRYPQRPSRLSALEERVSQLQAGISLLTDAVESGLRDVAQEIEKGRGEAPAKAPKVREAAQRRVTAAARRGRSVPEIAAKEQMSEGEVRLRLQMTRAAREKAHAAVR